MTTAAGTRGEKTPAGFTQLLRTSYEANQSMLCLGIDPILEYLPDEILGSVTDRIVSYYTEVLLMARDRGVIPGAFKPNLGFFSALDSPRSADFSGSVALSRILDLIGAEFPGTPVILDAKRGDIARSSTNYGREAFACWKVDAVTASPYMGHDSVLAILAEAKVSSGLVYTLALTSNPGAQQFQSLELAGGGALFQTVARAIVEWHKTTGCCGAVVGATHPEERDEILGMFSGEDVPVLIPGVGSQGGNSEDVKKAVTATGYPPALLRVNVSSAITHPWKDAGAPSDWRTIVGDSLARFHGELA